VMATPRHDRQVSRFDRPTEFAVALHFMHYNFCRVHQTLRVNVGAMAAVVVRGNL
jgi:hypothetical protein